MGKFFADSYGLIAFLEGNPRYVRIFNARKVVTSAINVAELYATLLRRISSKEARSLAAGFLREVTSVPVEAAILAGEFKAHMRSIRRDCSFVDAWGYAAARTLALPFLTGDPSFKGIEGVKFVR